MVDKQINRRNYFFARFWLDLASHVCSLSIDLLTFQRTLLYLIFNVCTFSSLSLGKWKELLLSNTANFNLECCFEKYSAIAIHVYTLRFGCLVVEVCVSCSWSGVTSTPDFLSTFTWATCCAASLNYNIQYRKWYRNESQ